MRRGVRKVLILALVATAAIRAEALAQQANPPVNRVPATQPVRKRAVQVQPAIDPNDPRMKKLLAAWEDKSAQLKTLDVMIHRIDKSPAWGNDEFEGRALLKAPNLAWLDFKKPALDGNGKQKLNANGKPMFLDHERIVCTGTEVWQFKPESKQIFIYPLDKKNKQKALEEGPLPFLFNMKAAEAEARYLMALVNENKMVFSISVVPRLQVDQEAFSKAFIVLDRKTYMPTRIFLFSPDGSSTKDFQLSDVRRNEPIEMVNFKPFSPGRPWEIIRNPGGIAAPAAAQGVRARPNLAPAPGNPPAQNAANPPRRPPAN